MIKESHELIKGIKEKRLSIRVNGIVSSLVYECFKLSEFAEDNNISKVALIKACHNPLTFIPLDSMTVLKINILMTFLGFKKVTILSLIDEYNVEKYNKKEKVLYLFR